MRILKNINDWGVPTLLLALSIQGLALFLTFNGQGTVSSSFLDSSLNSKLSLWVSVGLILICTLSYGRIHNAGIYILGVFLGSAGVLQNMHLISGKLPKIPHESAAQVLAGLFVGVTLCSVIPASLRFANVKKITLGLCFSFVLFVLFRNSSFLDVSRLMYPQGKPAEWYVALGIGMFGLNFFLSLVFLRSRFYMGGIQTGVAGILLGLWVSEVYLSQGPYFYQLGILQLNLFVILALILHWVVMVSHNIAMDPLMGIYNRNFCNHIIKEQSKIKTRPPLSIAMVDIDHFKKVNDTHGHQAGDKVLQKVAETLKKTLGKKGILCRYGGEEMIVFLPKTKIQQAETLLEKARLAIKQLRVKSGSKVLKVTFSAGIAQRESKSQSVESVIEVADKAVYKAKKSGRNRVQLHKAVVRRKSPIKQRSK